MTKLNGEWKKFKEEYVQCSTDQCETWTLVRVKVEKDLKNFGFVCGFCANNEILNLKTKLAESDVKMVDVTSVVDDKVKEMTESITEEKLKWTEVVRKNNTTASRNAVKLIKENLRKEIEIISDDDKQKKRMVVFGMHESADVNDRVKSEELLSKLDLDTEVGISDVFRLRKKGDISREAPLLIEFESESDKWKVLKKKVSLKQIEGYEKVFLEMDLSLEEMLEKAKHYKEKRREREETTS